MNRMYTMGQYRAMHGNDVIHCNVIKYLYSAPSRHLLRDDADE